MVATKVAGVLILLVLCLMTVSVALAATTPEGPGTFEQIRYTQRSPTSADQLNVTAGNITVVNVTGETVTQSWAGVVGNVTGTITLDDGNGETLYDWSVADPAGEIFATTASSVTWTNIECWNMSIADTDNYLTLSDYETLLNIASDDDDGVDETFNVTGTHALFYVANLTFAADSCGAATSVYTAGGTQNSALFQEVILYNGRYSPTSGETGDQDSIIFVGLLEDTDETGFDGTDYDFQILLAEDGHAGDTTTTTYNFYVELE